MDEDAERKAKLQAGKEALLAFQKKKSRKVKKKVFDVNDIGTGELSSISVSLGTDTNEPEGLSSLMVPTSADKGLKHDASFEDANSSVVQQAESIMPYLINGDNLNNDIPVAQQYASERNGVLEASSDFGMDLGHQTRTTLKCFKTRPKNSLCEDEHMSVWKPLSQSDLVHGMNLSDQSCDFATDSQWITHERGSTSNQNSKGESEVMHSVKTNQHPLEVGLGNIEHEQKQGQAHHKISEFFEPTSLQFPEVNLAYKKVSDERNVAFAEQNSWEHEVSQWKEKYHDMLRNFEVLQHENTALVEKYQLLVQSHSNEIKTIQEGSHELEQRLLSWKEKAAILEDKLSGSEARQQEVEGLRRRLESTESLLTQAKEKISESEASVQRYKSMMEELNNEHKQHIRQLMEEHKILELSYSSQVCSLENSLSDATADKASLELAEVHMKSLEKQLKDYRSHEISFQNKLSRMEQQHKKDIESLQQHYEALKSEEIEMVTTKYAEQLDALEQEFAKIQNEAQLTKAVNDAQENEVLKAAYQKETLQMEMRYKDAQELACSQLREELELSYRDSIEALKSQHKAEMVLVLKNAEIAHQSIRQKLLEEKEVEIQLLKQKHSANIQNLRVSLLESKDSPLLVSEARIMQLEGQLQAKENDWLSTRHDLDSKIKVLEGDLQDFRNSLFVANQENSKLVGQLRSKDDELKNIKEDCKSAINSADMVRNSCDQLRDQLGKCKLQLEEIDAQNASYKGKIAQLEQLIDSKHQEEIDIAMKNDLLLQAITQEKQQLSLELISLRDDFSKVQSAHYALSSSFAEKESELLHLKDELADMQKVHQTYTDVRLAEMCALKLQFENEANECQRQNVEDQEGIHQPTLMVADLQRNPDALLEGIDENNLSAKSLVQINTSDYYVVCRERDELLEELRNVQEAFQEQRSLWEMKSLEHEQQIKDLKAQLNTAHTDLESSTKQNGLLFTPIKQGLRKSSQAVVEESLSSARLLLASKLQEKADLEKNLSYHRIELERRLAEKNKLEALLAEKNKFEQQLQSQKEQLQAELHEIETRLQQKETELEMKQLESKNAIEAKDEEMTRRVNEFEDKVEQKQRCIDELGHLNDHLVKTHSAQLQQLSEDLTRRYHHDLKSLEINLHQRHVEALSSLEEKQKKELESLENHLLRICQHELDIIFQQVEELLKREFSMVDQVVEQEKYNDVIALPQALSLQYTCKCSFIMPSQLHHCYVYTCMDKLEEEREKLKNECTLYVDNLGCGTVSEVGQPHPLCVEQLGISYNLDMESLKEKCETNMEQKTALEGALKPSKTISGHCHDVGSSSEQLKGTVDDPFRNIECDCVEMHKSDSTELCLPKPPFVKTHGDLEEGNDSASCNFCELEVPQKKPSQHLVGQQILNMNLSHKGLFQAVVAANEEFSNRLIKELSCYREKLLYINNLRLWAQECKLAAEFSKQLEFVKSKLEEACIDNLAEIHVQQAIRNAVLTEIRAIQWGHNPIIPEGVADLKLIVKGNDHVCECCKELIIICDRKDDEIKQLHKKHKDILENICYQLSHSHMAKFKGMTDKLQQIHQDELMTVEQEKLQLQIEHKELISCLKEQMEAKHLEDIAQVTSLHTKQVLQMEELFRQKIEECKMHVVDLESQLLLLKQQQNNDAEQWYAREAELEGQLRLSTQDVVELKSELDKRKAELTTMKNVSVKEVIALEQLLSKQLEETQQHGITDNAHLLQMQMKLQDENHQLEAAMHLLTSEMEKLQESSHQLDKKLQEGRIQLFDCQANFTRQLKEKETTIVLLQQEMEEIKVERALLQTSLAAFHKVLLDSLQLISTVNTDFDEDNVLANAQAQVHDSFTTPVNFRTLYSSKVDSGIASRQTSRTFPSHPGGLDTFSVPSVSDQELYVRGSQRKVPVLNSAPDLSIFPLDHTLDSSSLHSHTTSLSVPALTIREDGHDLAPEGSQRPYDLSVYQLDISKDCTLPLSGNLVSSGLTEMQGNLSKLHCSVHSLIEAYVIASSQATEWHKKLEKLTDQMNIEKQEALATISELQDSIRQKESNITDKQEQLAAAEKKIRELVDVVENGGSELIEGVEDLLGAFKTNERTLAELKIQLEVSHSHLADKDTHINKLLDKTASLDVLLSKQEEAFNGERQEWQNVQLCLEQEMELLKKDFISLQQEIEALRESNSELRQGREKLDINMQNMEIQHRKVIGEYKEQLEMKCEEIRCLEDLPNQLAAKDEIIERFLSEKETLTKKLYIIEHELEEEKSKLNRENSQHLSKREEALSAAIEEQKTTIILLQESVDMLKSRVREVEDACLETKQSESEVRKQLALCEDVHQKQVISLEEKCLTLNHQLESLQCEHELKLQSLLQLKEKEHEELRNAQRMTLEAHLSEVLSDCKCLKLKNQQLHCDLAEKDRELELCRSIKVNPNKCQVELSIQNESHSHSSESVANVSTHVHDLTASNKGVHARYCWKIAIIKVLHGQQLSRLKQLYNWRVCNLSVHHQAMVEKMADDHEKVVKQLELKNEEAMDKLKCEMASQHAGEVAFLKMQCQQGRCWGPAQEGEETKGSVNIAEEDANGLTDEALLLKITELSPLLQADAESIKELCALTGQYIHVEEDGSMSPEPLQSLLKTLQDLLNDLRTKLATSDLEDWRKELFAAVEKILQHEHSVLANVTVHATEKQGLNDFELACQKTFQQQLSSYSAQLQQLQNAERESLVTEIRELRLMLDNMKAEQKEQTDSLHLQLNQVTESSDLEKQKLIQQLGELNSAHLCQSEELLQLRASLEAESIKSAELLKQHDLERQELEVENTRLESEVLSLTSTIHSLEEELVDSRRNFAELEELAQSAATTINALQQELKTAYSKEAKLNDMLESHESLILKHKHNLEQSLREIQKAQDDASTTQVALDLRKQEVERLRTNIATQAADHDAKMKHFSQLLDKEHKANGALKTVLQKKDAELQAKDAELQALKQECAGLQLGINQRLAHQLQQLHMQYRQAELHRKSLVLQKKYLQCQVDAFYQTQQASLMMMADMGVILSVKNSSSLPSQSHHFKTVALLVRSVLRFRLLHHKKLRYLALKLKKFHSSLAASPETPIAVATSPLTSLFNSGHGSTVSSASKQDP